MFSSDGIRGRDDWTKRQAVHGSVQGAMGMGMGTTHIRIHMMQEDERHLRGRVSPGVREIRKNKLSYTRYTGRAWTTGAWANHKSCFPLEFRGKKSEN